MDSINEEYYLLDELSKIVYSTRFDGYGKLVDQNGNPVSDEIDLKYDFYLIYNHAYCFADDGLTEAIVGDDYEPFFILKSYEMFNFLIKQMIEEYKMYNDIGTGNVSYHPYEKMAEYLFSETKYEFVNTKEVIINYLKTIYDFEKGKRRVKV